ALECGRKEMPRFSEEVVSQLISYQWPGNVRELKNVIERAVYRSDSQVLEFLEFDPFKNPFDPIKEERSATVAKKEKLDLNCFDQARVELELSYLKQALLESGGNQKEAAKMLNLTYDQLRGLYRKYQDRL
ncbi:MAG: AAA family ATPase, partial [Spirochaetia bacterium]|nr:AAA family ATPase [Spirochaetia bacterium]